MKIGENAYVANSWSRDALVGWHPKTFCDRNEFVASGLQPLYSVRYDLVATKIISEAVIYPVNYQLTYAVVSVIRNRKHSIRKGIDRWLQEYTNCFVIQCKNGTRMLSGDVVVQVLGGLHTCTE